MRLIIKTTLLYLLLALLVFGIGGVSIYDVVRKEVAKETDYALGYTIRTIRHAIENGQPYEAYQSDRVNISKVEIATPQDTLPIFTDTIAIHSSLKRPEQHRKLKVTKKINDEFYHFELLEVFIESGDVLDGVTNIITRLFIVLSLVLLLFSFLISKWLFRPFQSTLEKIGKFNLKSQDSLELSSTSTREFNELNEFIEQMTEKARRDYVNLKEFSENASHELQTPLAVAKGKLELLLESPDLNSTQLGLIQSAQTALTKLSKLSKSLSLLTKIENQEFVDHTSIDFSKCVKRSVNDFQEISQLKNISFESLIEEDVHVTIDSALADILIANLIKNAIQHNIAEGWIKVELNKEYLRISNSGKDLNVPVEQLFQRFRKNNQSGQSLGLGLAIVQKICEVSNLRVSYVNENEAHQVTVFIS